MSTYKIFSEPPLEVNCLSEVSNILREGGKLSFQIPRKSKKLFIKHIRRLNRLEKLRRVQKKKLSRYKYGLYFTYVMVIERIVCWNYNKLKHAFWIYFTFICDIATFDGKDMSDDIILITFNGRKNAGSGSHGVITHPSDMV